MVIPMTYDLRTGAARTAVWRVGVVFFLAAAIGGGWTGCGARAAGSPRSQMSFDKIQSRVAGKTEAEVEQILGKPDTREVRLVDDDVWIWWDYTFLDGAQYAPELRGQIVHLEITFDKPPGVEGRDLPKAGWRVGGPFSVNFSRRAPHG